MRNYSLQAIVLKNYNYKDADKVYTLLTLDKGKITATAKGVRKISSRRGGNLDTLNYVIVGITENGSDFKTITEVQLKNSFQNIKLSLEKSKMAYYVIELVYRFLAASEDQQAVFSLLLSALKKLDSTTSLLNASILVNAFELKLMSLLGYELTLNKCAVSGMEFTLDWEGYKFNSSKGGVTASQYDLLGRPISRETAYVLNYIDAHNKGLVDKPLIKFTKQDVDTADEIIKHYIQEMLEGSFRTMRVFEGI